MPFTFQMKFSYLCAFVPDRPFDDSTPPKNCRVLLRDLRDPSILDDPQNESCNAPPKPHFPVLTYRREDADPGNTTIPEGRIEPDDFENLIELQGEDLRIAIDESNPIPDQLSIVNGTPSRGTLDAGDRRPPVDAERRYLYWLVDPKRWDRGIRVHSDFATGRGPEGAPIAARVHLSDGDLFAETLTQDIWSIRRSPEDAPLHEQFLAIVVTYERRNINGFVDLQFQKFGEAEPKILRLRPAKGANPVEVNVRNCEAKRKFGSVKPTYHTRDCDFRLYYRLAGTGSATGPIIFPSNESHSGDSPCSPSATGGGG